MGENKTKPTDASVDDYIASRASEQQHSDCRQLLDLFHKITGHTPKMWGPSIVGFGSYRYVYESGRTGEAPLIGFAIRGRELVVYISADSDEQKALLSKLGKHRMGKACLYFKRLSDLDFSVLEALASNSVADTNGNANHTVRSRLLDMASTWFEASDVVEHYANEAAQRMTPGEQALLDVLDTSAIILDLGCGAGRVALDLASRGFDVTGADTSGSLLSVAKAKANELGLDVNFVEVAPLELPFVDGAFDAVLALKLYCYIPTRAGRHRYLKEIARVLGAHGQLFLSQYVVPDAHFHEFRDQYYDRMVDEIGPLEPGDTFPEGRGYARWFTEEQLLHELNNGPFTVDWMRSDADYGGTGLLRLLRLKKRF